MILQYHHISSSTPVATSLSPEIFKLHLDTLEEGGFTVMALPELISRIRANEPVKDKTVAITFDDGYKSVYDTAYPMLKQRGWPFTVFVVPQAIEEKQTHVMSWQQLQELSEDGVTIANHSYSHQHLLRKKEGETVKAWQQRVLDDIQKAEQIIQQHTGKKLKLFAWPYGEYSTALSESLENRGFIAVAQYSGAINKDSDFLALPRFTFNKAYGDIEDFILKAGSLPFVVKRVIP
ncbi:MAG: polysaccharide deacetylase family protein, partial [Gammaproteobacteria bacterium]|nr:polysaccharide deacetylase family protein [Gammaproteobacteria bacterium]